MIERPPTGEQLTYIASLTRRVQLSPAEEAALVTELGINGSLSLTAASRLIDRLIAIRDGQASRPVLPGQMGLFGVEGER